jgi:lipooligosaccharide transport system permease protein
LKQWRSEAPGFVIEPFLVLLAMGVGLGTYVALDEGQKYVDFIAPGIAGYGMFSATFECTYGAVMKVQKTYDAIIVTPLNIEDVAAGEVFWGATRALLTSCCILAVAAGFGLVHSPWAILVVPLSLLSGIMFASIALFFTSLAPSIYSFNYYFTLFMTPMFFFSGVFFPLDSFPPLVQHLSWIAPLPPWPTSAALASGDLGREWRGLAIMAGLTVLFLCLSHAAAAAGEALVTGGQLSRNGPSIRSSIAGCGSPSGLL